jgi:acetoin utilization protein AcuC
MSNEVELYVGEALGRYGFPHGHPFGPDRQDAFWKEAQMQGLPQRVELRAPRAATQEEIERFHQHEHVERVRVLSVEGYGSIDYGDTPAYPGVYDASANVVGAALDGLARVMSGETLRTFQPIGGLHHARRAGAAGFCVFNDCGVVVDSLRSQYGVQRVAYVDIDVHHGDGVQAAFWDDPRVLTISLHESGRTLFPGTGFPEEVGGADAKGMAVNVALPAGTGDAGWLRAFHAVVPPLVKAFAPTVLVSQHGCDTHALDPLANLLVSVDGQRKAHAALHALAHDVCRGRWVATGGGGYELVRVVPRTWTHLLAEAAGAPVDPETDTPEEWRDIVLSRTGSHAPTRMTDGRSAEFRPWEDGAGAPGDRVDAAIQATRDAVFAVHGLDPAGSA